MAKKFCISVYNTTRNFGGSEEGGWWYNWDEVVATLPCRTLAQAKRKFDAFAKRNGAIVNEEALKRARKRLSSVNDNGHSWAVIESHPYPTQFSKFSPHYE